MYSHQIASRQRSRPKPNYLLENWKAACGHVNESLGKTNTAWRFLVMFNFVQAFCRSASAKTESTQFCMQPLQSTAKTKTNTYCHERPFLQPGSLKNTLVALWFHDALEMTKYRSWLCYSAYLKIGQWLRRGSVWNRIHYRIWDWGQYWANGSYSGSDWCVLSFQVTLWWAFTLLCYANLPNILHSAASRSISRASVYFSTPSPSIYILGFLNNNN